MIPPQAIPPAYTQPEEPITQIPYDRRWTVCVGPRRSTAGRQTPLVGAGCLNWARPDLCGGRPAMAVPTANIQRRFASLSNQCTLRDGGVEWRPCDVAACTHPRAGSSCYRVAMISPSLGRFRTSGLGSRPCVSMRHPTLFSGYLVPTRPSAPAIRTLASRLPMLS